MNGDETHRMTNKIDLTITEGFTGGGVFADADTLKALELRMHQLGGCRRRARMEVAEVGHAGEAATDGGTAVDKYFD